MKLSAVVLSTSDNSEEVTFSVHEQDPGYRYLVRAIVGIDAEDIVPKFYGIGKVSKAKFYEYTMKPRDIVMRVALNPNYSINEDVSEIRDAVYRLISRNRAGQLTMSFRSSGSIGAVIQGMIIKMEVAYFTETPELQITVRCDDPVFRSPLPVELTDDDLPGSNPVTLMDGLSTAPHGFELDVIFVTSTASFTIQDKAVSPDWRFVVTPSGGFVSGDILHFSSEYQQKLLMVEKISGDVHLMDKISADSEWPQIFPGANKLYFLTTGTFDWLTLSYHSAYWGL